LGFPFTRPFNMKFLALGNENGCSFDTFKIYNSYYAIFAKEVKAKYPGIELIANCDISGSVSAPVDSFDYHVYQNPQWFLTNTGIFDKQNRKGSKIFVSEYAVTSDCGNGNLRAALAEAAWVTGLIRNSDIVTMVSYAPLFVNLNDRAWNPDAIEFDSSVAFGTPSYYVQLMYSKYTGSALLSSSFTATSPNLAAISTLDKNSHKLYIALINYSGTPEGIAIDLQNTPSTLKQNGVVYSLSSASLDDENTRENLKKVVPKSSELIVRPQFNFTLAAHTFVIVEMSLQ